MEPAVADLIDARAANPPVDADLLAGLVQNSPDAVLVVDDCGVVRYANEAVREVLGYEPTELLDHPYAVLIPSDVRAVHERHHARYMDHQIARPMGEGISLRARHRAGHDLDVAIALVPIGGPERLVATFIREMSPAQRLIGRLSATNDVLTAALAGETQQEVEQRIVELTCGLLNATTAWLLVRPSPDEQLGVAAECGDVTNRSVVDAMIEGGLIESVVDPTVVQDSDVAHAPSEVSELLVVPVRSQSLRGALVAARSSSPRFDPADLEVAGDFARAIAITLALIAVNSEVELLRSISEHDRIARDLHDTVIQRLFAVAMRLESAVSGSTGVAAERMSEAVDSLDDVIREIRSTIFDLRRPHEAASGLRAAIAVEIDRVAELLGFAPSLRLVGTIDASVPDDAANEAAAVIRELLSNVVRHARASAVDVTVRIDENQMSVVVEDDGVGIEEASTDGNGLPNVITRARTLGGSFVIAPTAPHGVRAEWAVPLGADA